MELNIINFLYLFFRLAPFIIVCYFSLSSLFNQDIKGLIYLVGLLVACFLSILAGNMIPKFVTGPEEGMPQQMNPICNLVTIGKDGSFSKIPLGLSILSYTLIYLAYIIAVNHIEMSNIPTLIFFPTLIVADMVWNIKNTCYPPFAIVLAVVIGGLMGLIWAAIIDSLKQPRLFFLNVGSDKTVCHRPSKQLFKCQFKMPTA